MKKITTHAAGKRKRAIAKATISEGKGIVRINSQLLENYNPIFSRMKIREPLILAEEFTKKLNINVRVTGGGYSSQADAIRLAISRALVAHTKSKALKDTLLKYDRHLLIADTRRKEVYKPNDSKARAKRQSSKR